MDSISDLSQKTHSIESRDGLKPVTGRVAQIMKEREAMRNPLRFLPRPLLHQKILPSVVKPRPISQCDILQWPILPSVDASAPPPVLPCPIQSRTILPPVLPSAPTFIPELPSRTALCLKLDPSNSDPKPDLKPSDPPLPRAPSPPSKEPVDQERLKELTTAIRQSLIKHVVKSAAEELGKNNVTKEIVTKKYLECKNEILCICKKERAVVACFACKNAWGGRVKKTCIVHPKVQFLMDFDKCPNCKRTNYLKEFEFETLKNL
jgi:hypothetical protein